MKKIPLILVCLCLFASPVYALSAAIQAVVGASSAPAGCSASTDYVGDKSDLSAGTTATSPDVYFCISYQAITSSCSSGTLGAAYIAHHLDSTQSVKMAVYTDSTSGTGAPNGESRIGDAASLTCSTDTPTPTCTNGSDLGGTVDKDAYYFLCIIGTTAGFDYHRVTTGRTVYYKGFTGGYATPVDTLTATGWSDGGTRDRGAYVEIK